MNPANIVGLIVPVCHEYSYVVQLEDHLRVLLKRLTCLVLVVLAADTDDNATVLEFLYPLLDFSIGLPYSQAMAYLNVLPTVITHDSTPKGVVQIQYKTLGKPTFDCADNIPGSGSHKRQRIQTQKHFRAHINAGIKEKIPAKLCLQFGKVADIKIGGL